MKPIPEKPFFLQPVAYQNGWYAMNDWRMGEEKKPRNPYTPGTKEYHWWKEGWKDRWETPDDPISIGPL